jgi:polysaccharide pyruvyl transferase WcaK-like protein
MTAIPREALHSLRGYQFLLNQDLLIVSGGGQLDEEWGGPWGHPFGLFKWAVLSRIARVPFVFASVGACNATSSLSQLFLSRSLRIAQYRSFRDRHSRKLVASFWDQATNDPIVPDLGFSLAATQSPPPAGIRSIAQGRPIIAISPIAFAKSGKWPVADGAIYDRYVRQMAGVVSALLKQGYFVVLVCSSIGDDDSVMEEICEGIDNNLKAYISCQLYIPVISNWRDLLSSLKDVDILIASRLHSAILGFVAHKPTIAISFDAKVNWLMEDLGQEDCLLQICDFVADDVLAILGRIQLERSAIEEQIIAYQERISSILESQYDGLAASAMAECQHRN